MEIANLGLRLRPAVRGDGDGIATLIQGAPFNHVHVDWRLPTAWLGQAGSVVAEDDQGRLAGCFAVGADPPPAAWVRLAIIADADGAFPLLQAMSAYVLPALPGAGLTQLGWLARPQWKAAWLDALGFSLIDEVESFVRLGTTLKSEDQDGSRAKPAVTVRSVRFEDLPDLAAIERAAFDPLWRHSVDGLRRGWQQALSFDVAERDGRLVGFQYSVRGENKESAHLVRMTVSPNIQRSGVGTALLREAFRTYRRLGIRRVSLNTQVSNVASKRLYRRFGFESAGYRLPVWLRPIGP